MNNEKESNGMFYKGHKSLFGGMFMEVFENREHKSYGHFTYKTDFMLRKFNSIFIFAIIASLFLFSCSSKKLMVRNKTVSPQVLEPVKPDNSDRVHYTPRTSQYYLAPKILTSQERYEMAYDELKAMLIGIKNPDFERAVFISENPYHDNEYVYENFQKYIDFHLFSIKKLIAYNDKSDSIDFNVKVNQYGRFNIDDIRHLPYEKKELYQKALANWAIFTYITDTTVAYFYHAPFTYATHDPFGIKDWSNSQVINLLQSQEQKGNCFALTALFKIFSDRLKSDARLCTAPQHIYIQHRDPKGDYYNVELATAGHPGDGTIQTLTHTTTEAIKSGIALRSYDRRQSIGLCLINLAKSYEHKFQTKGDEFMLRCSELVLKYDSLNLNALLLKQQILDARVTDYAIENNINDINKLKANNEISQTVYELEKHIALLYNLGYRQMPYDMQEIIMTGIYPEKFEDKNLSPFTTIDPKDEHRKKYSTLYGGLFQEVFEKREYEPYGHFTFKIDIGQLTVIDTSFRTGFLIDPVAFAYDFGARLYDARLGRFMSIDPKASGYPSYSPYHFCASNPIVYVEIDGAIYEIYLKVKNNGETRFYVITFDGEKSVIQQYSEEWKKQIGKPTTYIREENSPEFKFAEQVLNSYEYFVNNDADIDDAMKISAQSKEIVRIYETEGDATYEYGEIYMNFKVGLKVFDSTTGEYIGNQSPALGFWSEVYHFYLDIIKSQYIKDEETYVHVEKEQKVINSLNKNIPGNNETPRKNYDDAKPGFNAKSETSTEEK